MILWYIRSGVTFRLEAPQSLVEAVASPTIIPLTTFSEETPAIGELMIDDLRSILIFLNIFGYNKYVTHQKGETHRQKKEQGITKTNN